MLAYTGEPRNSGINNWEVMKGHIDGDRAVHRNFDRIAQIAREMRRPWRSRIGTRWPAAAAGVEQPQEERSRNQYAVDRPAGPGDAAGGRGGAKVCGAGGGGCVFFLVKRGAKPRVSEAIEKEGATVLPVRVAPRGVVVV